MAWEMREGQGSLFKNDKAKNPKAPGYRGEIMIGGQIYRLSAWVREGKRGKFFSLQAQPKDDAPRQSKPAPALDADDDPNDPIPF